MSVPDVSFPEAWTAALAACGADDATLTALADAAAGLTGAPLLPGRVTRSEHGLATVTTPDGPLRATPGRGPAPCTGDWVLASVADPAAPVLTAVLPRRTALVRHAAGKRTEPQTLAAGLDDVFIVAAADRAVSLGRIERFLALAWDSGAAPVVVLSKADLLPPDAGGPLLSEAMSAAPGAEVHLISAHTGDGIGALAARLGPGRTAALVGSSGAGKSSLVNALAGAEVAVTDRVRGVDGKGRHTTAWRELIVLPGGGALIDTPGLRGLGLWLDEGGLEATFADIAELAAGCRFGDCGHDTEPGCAVTAAIEAGELPARRLASYRKLEREAAYVARKADPRLAREAARHWAALAKGAQARTRHDPRSS